MFGFRLRGRDIEGYLFLLPWLIGLVVFRLVSILASAGLSLMNWDLLRPPGFVGLQNYRDLLADPLFWTSLGNTLYYVVGSVPLVLVLALLAAFLLSRPLPGVGVLRTIYYLPSGSCGRSTTSRRSRPAWPWRCSGSGCSSRPTASSTPSSAGSASPARPGWGARPGRCRR